MKLVKALQDRLQRLSSDTELDPEGGFESWHWEGAWRIFGLILDGAVDQSQFIRLIRLIEFQD